MNKCSIYNVIVDKDISTYLLFNTLTQGLTEIYKETNNGLMQSERVSLRFQETEDCNRQFANEKIYYKYRGEFLKILLNDKYIFDGLIKQYKESTEKYGIEPWME